MIVLLQNCKSNSPLVGYPFFPAMKCQHENEVKKTWHYLDIVLNYFTSIKLEISSFRRSILRQWNANIKTRWWKHEIRWALPDLRPHLFQRRKYKSHNGGNVGWILWRFVHLFVRWWCIITLLNEYPTTWRTSNERHKLTQNQRTVKVAYKKSVEWEGQIVYFIRTGHTRCTATTQKKAEIRRNKHP